MGRSLHRMLMLVLALGLLLLLGAAALAWRLAQGPLDVAWLARQAEAVLNAGDAPARVQIGQATMRWRGFHEGAGGGLDLALRNVQVVNRSGAPGAAVAEADVSLSLGRLLIGQAVPRSVRLQGVRLRAVRALDGSVALDLGGLNDSPAAPGPSLAETLRQLGRPASHDGAGERALEELAQLRHVQVEDAVIQVMDAQLGAAVALTVARLDLQRQPGGGVRGTAEGQMGLGGAVAALTLQAELAADGGTSMTAVLAPLKMTEVARANAALDPLAMLDATVQAQARLDLSPALQPRSAVVQASAGGGTLLLGGVQVAFQSLALELGAGWTGSALRPGTLTLRRAQVVLASPRGGWSTTLGATAQAVRAGGRITGTFEAALDHVEFADLAALWPEPWGGNVRPWLVQNLTAGTARDGTVRLGFEAREDFTAPVVVQASGSLLGDDATIHWLRPVPPIEHAQAVLTVRNPDVIEIAIPSARQGAMALRDGSVRITGLSAKDQVMSVGADIGANVAEVVALLRHPRLRLLDRKPIPMRNPAGTLAGRLTVDLPLEHDLDFDQVKIRATGRLANLHLGGLVAGRDLDRGDVQIEVTSEQLKASGPANIANIPAVIAVEMDFRGGPPAQVVQRARATARATGRQLAGAGLDPGGLIASGAGAFTAAYTARRDGQAEVRVEADLRDTALELVGWKKPPGQPATASARVVLRGDKLLGIDQIEAQGPGMLVSGRADMVGDRPLLLQFERLVLGNTQASGEVRMPAAPAEPIRARLSGAVLDLAGELARKPGRPGPQDRDPAWVADIRFDRVLLAAGRGLSGVQAHAEHDGVRLRVLQAASSGPEQAQVVIAPRANGRQLSVRAADGGAVLRALDVVDTVQGGRLSIEAAYDDRQPRSPLSGTAELTGFALRDAPAVGKLLQAVTLFGLVDALRGPGLQFAQLTLPFRYDGDVLDVGEARAFSASLGITVQGRVDLVRRLADMKGTVVPAYMFNTLLGRIPLVGRIFSPEAGGGLVAMDYTLRGPMADPAVSVNPLSALTPGFLRGLFKIFD